MEHHKISKTSIIKRFSYTKVCDKKWIEVNDLSTGQYSINKNVRFKTRMIRSNLCGYRNVYISVKGQWIF